MIEETEVPPFATMPNRRWPAELRIGSAELPWGQRRFVLGDGGTEYRLDITRAGQLILTR